MNENLKVLFVGEDSNITYFDDTYIATMYDEKTNDFKFATIGNNMWGVQDCLELFDFIEKNITNDDFVKFIKCEWGKQLKDFLVDEMTDANNDKVEKEYLTYLKHLREIEIKGVYEKLCD